MSVTIDRTAMTDDDGTGTTGTIINNAWKTQLYDQIDAALAEVGAYVEGTWTPVIGGAGGQSGQAYAFQVGRYVKVGKLVTAYGFVKLSTKGTITGAVQIQGLPFTSENVGNSYPTMAISYFEGLATNWIALGGLLAPNAAVASVVGRQSAGTDSAGLAASDISNSTLLGFTVTYCAAS